MPSSRKSRKQLSKSIRYMTSLLSGKNPAENERNHQNKKLAKRILSRQLKGVSKDLKTPDTPGAKEIFKLYKHQKQATMDPQVESLIERTTDLVNLERNLSPELKADIRRQNASRRSIGGKSKRKSRKHRKTRKISSFFQIF